MHAYFSLAEQYMHKKYLLALKPSTFKDGMSMKTIISPLKIFRERFKKRCCRDTGSLYELLPKLLTPLTFVLRPLNHPHRPTDTWLGRHSESAKTSSQLALETYPQSGFTCPCTLHIFKSCTILQTSLGRAQNNPSQDY